MPNYKIFDTHCYTGLISPKKTELNLSLQYAKIFGVEHILNITNTIGDFEDAYNALKTENIVSFAVGVSPIEVHNPALKWREKLEAYSKFSKVIAIGETGLDYQKGSGDIDLQKEFFIYHIKLAQSVQKPLIVHNRAASRDIIRILRDNLKTGTAVFHCYSEKPEVVQEALKLPVYFSFSGNITYPKSHETIDACKMIPLDRMLVESGTPFMSPFAHRQERNKIQNITDNIQAIAQIKGVSFEECSAKLYQNSLQVFGLTE